MHSPPNTLGFTLLLLLLLTTTSHLYFTAVRADVRTRSILPDLATAMPATPTTPATASTPNIDALSMSPAMESVDERIVRELIASMRPNVLSSVRQSCRFDLNRTLAAFGRREAWAIAMYDASVKLPSGIEHGAVYQFGNFDECMAAVESTTTTTAADVISNSNDPSGVVHRRQPAGVQPMYCLARVRASGYSVRAVASRHMRLHNHTVIHWGVCLPSSCSTKDAAELLAAWTGHAHVDINARRCHRRFVTAESGRDASIGENIDEISAGGYGATDVLVACIVMAMVSMVVFCSGFHAIVWLTEGSGGGGKLSHRRRSQRSAVEQVIMSFSLIENIQKLGQESRDELGLSSINGIKAFAMIFIIAGHALLFMIGGPQLNTDFYAHEYRLVQNALFVNSPLLVDTFLLLSGFLFAHLVLVELEKRNGAVNFGMLYVFRYIRLTPAYLAVIALYATWLPRLGDGPLWDSRMELERERCRSSWWINILYVNNYVGTDRLCMFQSWYLAADTQLFVLAPLVVYPLWRWRRCGLAALFGWAIASVLVPLVATLAYDTDPSLLPYADEVEDITTNRYFVDWYIKTHMRATSYLFGILAGFLVHYVRENDIKFSRTRLWLLWLTAIAVGLASMFTIVTFFGTQQSVAVRALYAGLHRLGWSFATAWIVFACALGYAGPLRTFLSSRALVPLSRLTYCAYLTNGLVELYQAASLRTPKYMSTINMLGETTSHVLLTFIGALVLCLIFESPIHGLEKIFLRRSGAGGSSSSSAAAAKRHQQNKQCGSDSSSLGPNTESDSTTSS